MKAIVLAAASALALAPAVTSAASAGQATAGTWSFTDYTADPSSLAADDAFHVATGTTITSYCHGSRVPSSSQDVTSRALTVSRSSVLALKVTTTGAWGVDVVTRHGKTAAATNGTALKVRLRPGQYVVEACNLGGAPTAQVDYRLR